jgi:hypothetical protein
MLELVDTIVGGASPIQVFRVATLFVSTSVTQVTGFHPEAFAGCVEKHSEKCS